VTERSFVISEFTLKLYEILGVLNRYLSDPIMNLSKSTSLPLFGVLLIGILGATAPCQLTTNLGAIGFITKEGSTKNKLLRNTLWYTFGKIIVFSFYGLLLVLLKINISSVSIPFFSFTRKLMGPMIIMIGLYILNVFRLQGSIGNYFIKNVDAFTKKYKRINPSFIMGILFSFAFCPTLFWLFFGIVIPLSLKSPMGLVYPPVFALGTLLPIVLILLLVMFGKTNQKVNIK